MMPGSQEQLNPQEKMSKPKNLDIIKEARIESEQQLGEFAQERSNNLEIEAANLEGDGQKRIENANNSIGLSPEKIEEAKSAFGLQGRLRGVYEKGKVLAQEGKEKIGQVVVTKEFNQIADATPFVGGAKKVTESVVGKTLSGEELKGMKRVKHGVKGGIDLGLDIAAVGEVQKGVRLAYVGKKLAEGVKQNPEVVAKLGKKILEKKETTVAGQETSKKNTESKNEGGKEEKSEKEIVENSEEKNIEKEGRYREKITNQEVLKIIDENSEKVNKELADFENEIDSLVASGKQTDKKAIEDLILKNSKIAGDLVFGAGGNQRFQHIDEHRLSEAEWEKVEGKFIDKKLAEEKSQKEERLTEAIGRLADEGDEVTMEKMVKELSELDEKYANLKKEKINASRRIDSMQASAFAIGVRGEDIAKFLQTQEKLKAFDPESEFITKKDFDVAKYRAYYETHRTGKNIFTHVTSSERAEQIIRGGGMKSSKLTLPENMRGKNYENLSAEEIKELNALGQTANVEESIYFTSGGGGYSYGSKIVEGRTMPKKTEDFVFFATNGNEILASGKSIEVATPSLKEQHESLRGRAVGDFEKTDGAELSVDALYTVVPESQAEKYRKIYQESGFDENAASEKIIAIPDAIIEKAKDSNGYIQRDSEAIQNYVDNEIKKAINGRSKHKNEIYATVGGRKSTDPVSGEQNTVFKWQKINENTTRKAKDMTLEDNNESNFESSELISDATKLKEELTFHIKSDEYLAKLKKELNGNEDEAKRYQKIRAENLESVKITPLSLSEMKEKFGKDDPPGANVVGYYDPVGHEAFIAYNHKDKYITAMHELIHASTRQEKDITEKAKKILAESTKEGSDDYLKKPEERIARKQILDLEMDKLGIKKYGEEFKDEHYEKLMEYFKEGKLSRPAKEFINTTKPEEFKKIFDELAKNESSDSVFSI